MKIKSIQSHGLLLLGVTFTIFALGCATHHYRSYNDDFAQSLPTSPKYQIENVSDTQFQVEVHQGSSMPDSQRVVYVKEAAAAVADSEAKRRGWENWSLNYIQERDQGWMRVVIADVNRKNPIERTNGVTQ